MPDESGAIVLSAEEARLVRAVFDQWATHADTADAIPLALPAGRLVRRIDQAVPRG